MWQIPFEKKGEWWENEDGLRLCGKKFNRVALRAGLDVGDLNRIKICVSDRDAEGFARVSAGILAHMSDDTINGLLERFGIDTSKSVWIAILPLT
jgi:hypothetical protein